MAIAVRATTLIATGSSTAPTVSKPSGAVDGDFVFVLLGYNDPGGANTASPPDGTWTLSIGPVRESAGGTMYYIFGKVLSGDGASWTFSGPNTSWSTAAIAYSGTGLTVDVSGSGNCGTSGNTAFVAGAVTTTQTNTRVIYCVQLPQNISFTSPGGVTEQLDTSSATFGWGKTVGDKTQAGTGTTGTCSFTGSSTAAATNIAAYFTIAIYEVIPPGGLFPKISRVAVRRAAYH